MSGGPVLVTGATGRLGRSVLEALGARGVAGVRRREDERGYRRGAILVTSDGEVDRAALTGIAAVINCAGRVDGPGGEIEQANVAYPTALARAARQAGVARFVQVSSFSVFGRTEHIGPESPVAPADAYGRSKAAAEGALAALDAPGFRTLPLRLPFMFSADHPAHLGRLVATLRRLRVLPAPAGKPSRRSMMTYAGAADALVALADGANASGGAAAAADPRPLALDAIARAVEARLGTRIVILPVPGPVVTAVGAVAPGLANRLFRSSVLDERANLLFAPGPNGVEEEMHAYLDRLAGVRPSAGHPGGT